MNGPASSNVSALDGLLDMLHRAFESGGGEALTGLGSLVASVLEHKGPCVGEAAAERLLISLLRRLEDQGATMVLMRLAEVNMEALLRFLGKQGAVTRFVETWLRVHATLRQGRLLCRSAAGLVRLLEFALKRDMDLGRIAVGGQDEVRWWWGLSCLSAVLSGLSPNHGWPVPV
jgi:hypothetical protein